MISDFAFDNTLLTPFVLLPEALMLQRIAIKSWFDKNWNIYPVTNPLTWHIVSQKVAVTYHLKPSLTQIRVVVRKQNIQPRNYA